MGLRNHLRYPAVCTAYRAISCTNNRYNYVQRLGDCQDELTTEKWITL